MNPKKINWNGILNNIKNMEKRKVLNQNTCNKQVFPSRKRKRRKQIRLNRMINKVNKMAMNKIKLKIKIKIRPKIKKKMM